MRSFQTLAALVLMVALVGCNNFGFGHEAPPAATGPGASQGSGGSGSGLPPFLPRPQVTPPSPEQQPEVTDETEEQQAEPVEPVAPPPPEPSEAVQMYQEYCLDSHNWNYAGCHLFEVSDDGLTLRPRKLQLEPLSRDGEQNQYVWFNGAEMMVAWRDAAGRIRFNNNINPSRVRLVEVTDETLDTPRITYLHRYSGELSSVRYCNGEEVATLERFVEFCVGEIQLECRPNQCWPTR